MTNYLVELSEALQRRTLTLFVGADLPTALTGLPSRAELAQGLSERHGLAEGLSLATTAQQVMQRGNRFGFTDYIGRQLDTQGRTPGPIHQAIAALPVLSVITTCYDNLLEQAYREANTEINRLVRDSDLLFIDRDRPTLLKLYGDLQQRDTLIVTEDDQYSLWRNRDKEMLLDEVRRMLHNTVLFIGHNLADPDFMLLWREALDRMGRFAVGAYAVCPGMSPADQRVWAERMIWIIDGEPLALLAALAGNQSLHDKSTEAKTNRTKPSVSPQSAAPPPRPSADLAIWLRQRAGASHEAIVTFRPPDSPVDEQLVSGAPPAVAIDPQLLLPHSLDIDAYGEMLAAAFFADKRLALALVRAQERALGAGVPLRLRLQLDSDDPALYGVRWELLRDPERDHFLCTRDRIHFSRYLSSTDGSPISTDEATALTALVAVADPSDASTYGLSPLDTEAQLAYARTALAGYTLDELPHATLPTLADRLRAGPAVLYLICHGALLANGETCLYLEGPDGRAAPASAARVAAAISGLATRPRLVVLAACQSAGHTARHGSGLIALGPQLAQAGVSAVIAMHDDVAVDTVTAGMPVLFDELRRHGDVGRAAAAMRNVLATRGDDWWQPVLYLRLRDGRLWGSG